MKPNDRRSSGGDGGWEEREVVEVNSAEEVER